MKVFLNAALPGHLVEARRWLPSLPSLTAIEHWISGLESDLGECFVFVEGVLKTPRHQIRISPNGQIDLLLAFRTCALSLEIKGHNDSRFVDFSKLAQQIGGQKKWMCELLKEAKREEKSVSCAAFFPALDEAGLQDAERAIRGLGRTDIPVRGGNGQYGWNQNFADRLRKGTMETRGDLNKFFHSCFDQGQGYLREFPSFHKANSFLATVIDTTVVAQLEGYVPNLRETERLFAHQLLKTTAAVILVGARGIGKSVLAREILNDLGLPVHVVTNSATSVQKLVQQIAKVMDGMEHHSEPWEPLLRSLIRQPGGFWIQESGESSRGALSELVQRIESANKSEAIPSRWVVECHVPVSSLSHTACQVHPLDNRALAAILDLVPSQASGTHFEAAITRSGGNPRDAIVLWQSEEEFDITAGYSAPLAWLTGWKRKLAAALATALQHSPLGIPPAILSRWAATMLAGRTGSEVEQGFEDILALFVWNGLAERVHFSADSFEGQLNEVIGTDLKLDLIIPRNFQQLRIVAKELSDNGNSKQLLERWLNLLIEHSGDSPLVKATASLLSGEVDEFFFSSFRWSSISPVIAWLETEPDIEWSASGGFLLKAIRLSGRRPLPSPDDLIAELGVAPLGNKTCEMAKIMLSLWCRLPFDSDQNYLLKDFGFDQWINAVGEVCDTSLRVELLCWAADWLGPPCGGKLVGLAWQILRGVLEDETISGQDRMFAVLKALELLNRRKILHKAMSGAEADTWRARLAPELITYAMQVKDLQLLCDAIYHPARAFEFVQARTNPRSSIVWEPALEFAERYTCSSGLKARALLTLSSIHRHVLRSEAPWIDFVAHAAPSIEYARRALRYSQATGIKLHQLDALSYLSMICLTCMRYHDLPDCYEWFRAVGKEIFEQVDHVAAKLATSTMGPRERETYENICFNLVYIRFAVLSAGHEPPTNEQIAYMRNELSATADMLKITTQSGRDPRYRADVRSIVDRELKRLVRMIHFARGAGKFGQMLLQRVAPDLHRCLRVTKVVYGRGVSTPKCTWAKLCVELGEELPASSSVS